MPALEACTVHSRALSFGPPRGAGTCESSGLMSIGSAAECLVAAAELSMNITSAGVSDLSDDVPCGCSYAPAGRVDFWTAATLLTPGSACEDAYSCTRSPCSCLQPAVGLTRPVQAA